MTEDKIKEMLKDIIDNGAEYEYRWLRTDGYSSWKPYKLSILWDVSRVEKWCVIKVEYCPDYIITLKNEHNKNELYFEGSKEECEKWVEANTKKTWLEEYLDINCDNKIEAHNSKIDIENVCKEILEEMENRTLSSVSTTTLRNIIKDLGVEL